MKKKLFALLLVAICAISCQNGIWDAIRDLEDKYTDLDGRVAKLEELCKEMNTNISSLQTLVSVILTNDYIISVTPITKDGKEIGYVITFAIHEPITIYHGQNGADGKDGKNGQDGKDGKNGENGTNGQNGKDGADGITPIIGVAQDETDHAYYWTLNGEWLLDANGNRIPLSSRDGINGQDGQDGKDGKDGTNGQDGITPRLKIENGYWFISYDNGVTWTQLGKAAGENGQDGQDGEKGDKGDPGEPGYSMFTEVTQDDEFVYFTLYNGTVLTVRKGNSTFDQTIIDNLVTSLTLDQTEVWIAKGEQTQIISTTAPFSTSKVTWFSSDENIVIVENGLLTGIGRGISTIVAKSGDKSVQLIVYVGLGAEFSVSSTQKVHFSTGRLQYNPTEGTHVCRDGSILKGTWRFAENQYAALNVECTSSSYDGWCDLFKYGTSGHNVYNPYGTSSPKSDLTENTDWGRYNPIENGGNICGIWRCLSEQEWIYISNNRPNANSLRAIGTINNIEGFIFLPDNCILPTGVQFNANTANNTYTEAQWKILEESGAIFLPNIGENVKIIAWSSSYYSQPKAMSYQSASLVTNLTATVCPVRLVQDIK